MVTLPHGKLRTGDGEELRLTVDLPKLFDQMGRLWYHQALSRLPRVDLVGELVLRVTGSGAELGAVLAVASIPGTVLTPAGGVMSDRYSPASIMIWVSAERVLLLALLTLSILADATQLWHSSDPRWRVYCSRFSAWVPVLVLPLFCS